MNEELIEKLDDQAFEFAMSSISYGGENFSDIQRDKFAELLIKECASLFDKELTVSHEENIVRQSILSHFGLADD